MKRVLVYSSLICPYCVMAKRLLSRKAFAEIWAMKWAEHRRG